MIARSPWDRLKTKNFYMILVLVAVSTVAVWILSSPSPNLQTIVSKTQSGIKMASSLQIKEHQELIVDPTYLRRLGLAAGNSVTSVSVDAVGNQLVGLDDVPDILPSPKVTSGLPVIASAVRPDLFKEAAVLMKSVQSFLPEYKVIMYDLGLSTSEQVLLTKYCNSTWNCETTQFKFDKYPAHIKYLNIWSYRPLCIQETLNKYGAVIWVDDGHYFINGNLSNTLSRAREFGIQGWTIKDPTSSFTHLTMFKFFNMDQGSYYFQHAVESSHLVVYNTEKIARDLMLPWVKCALLEECISPPGAQNSGCNYFRRPLYKYSGCHRYDMSALNIILGKAFKFEEELYTSKDKVFGSLLHDQMLAENKTGPEYDMRLGVNQQVKI
ncbi:unnamed protein product [Candidula unifasciata]|uniref:Uncharacterized protein n=1 Tax=Candidula unifasciata TaxID=100452 RepID=A0A8S3ZKI0_9EUPU|nr:unnamed protein product [Candidula unifasciata]